MRGRRAVLIVAAALVDCAALARAHAACFDPAWSLADFRAHLDQPTGLALKASPPERPEDVAGFVLARVAAGEAEILSLGVIPDHRRRGIAAQMLTQLEISVAGRGAHQLFLEVGVDNPAAIALYWAAGFERTGLRKGYYGRAGQPAVDAQLLSKRIGPP